QPSVISGTTNVCEGNSETYSVAFVSGVSYNWTFPAGWVQTAGGTSNTIDVTVGSGSGDIQVTPSNGTCDGLPRTLAVVSADIPAQPSSVSGNPNVCDGTSETYSVTNVPGVSYNWTVPTGWIIDSGNGTSSITVSIVGFITGNIEVTPSNTCGSGTLSSLAVSSSAIAQPSTITGEIIVCEGSTETYSVTNVSGLTYNWSVPVGWTIDSGGGTNSITVTVGSGSGNVEVTPSNACGSGPTRLIAVTSNAVPTITATTPGSINGPGTVVLNAETSIPGSTISLYANAVGGVALDSAIDLGPGLGANLTTPGIITTTTFYIDANNGPCFSTPRVPVVATVHYSEITVYGNGNIILDEDNTPITTDYTNLGDTPILVGLTRTYTIENTGTIDLTIGTINITGANASDFVVNTAPAATIIPGGSTTFSITFTPTTLGIKNANVSFITNDPDENPFNFDIRGTGSTGLYPEINVQGNGNDIIDGAPGTSTTNHTDFGSVTLPGSIIRTFTIHNTGTGSLLLTGVPIVVITGSSNFTVTSQPSSSSIAAGGNLTFQITFNPSVTGTFDAIVSIDNSDANETIYDFAISGSATVSGIEIDIQGNEISIVDGDNTPDILDQTDFGITDSATPIPHTFNIYSLGSSTLTMTTSIVSITGTDAVLFTSTAIGSTSLGAGAVTSFVVTFTPTASLGVKTATITINNNDSDEGTYSFDIMAEVQTIPAQLLAPGGITSNLKFWLKADSNIGVVSDNSPINTWYDQTFGSTKNAISRTLKEPRFQNNTSYNVNFNPVIHFDGNDFMSGGQGFNNTDMFIVLKPTNNVNYTTSPMDIYCGDDITTNRGSQDVTGIEMGNTSNRHTNELFAYNQGAETSYGVSEISTTKFYTGVNIFNPRKHDPSDPSIDMDILNNGNTIITSEANTGTYIDIVNSRYWLGRSEYWDASYNGDILEIINYNIRNNDTDKRKIETYLAIKYGITLGTSPHSLDYLDSDGTVIYNAGASYNFNIAGIGRDDKSELNQKQSKSENATVINDDITIGLGDIYDKNSDNPNNFAIDKEFLVWGHNNNTLVAQDPIVVNISAGITPSLTTNVDFISIGRTWRVIESGGNVPSCKVSIPKAMIDATLSPPGNYLMFISNNPVFSPSAEYRVMDENGPDLEADYDFDGIKYITFGYAPERTFSRSIYFDGVVDYLDAGNVLDLNPSEFTISAWIKRGSASANKSIVSKRDFGYSNGGYDFKITSTGKVELSWKNGTIRTIFSNTTIPINVWHQVAVIYNGTEAKLYIDGVLDKTTPLGPPINPTSNSESFIIAAADGEEANTSAFFEGNIDEVRVWNKALSEDELHFIMNQEIEDNSDIAGSYFTAKSIIPTKNDIARADNTLNWVNLQGYYPMSTYTYTNLKDASGNGNRAALKNLNTVDLQTAPLPYVSAANTNWDTESTWVYGNMQTIPGSASLVDPTKTVDWNIVQISSNVTMNNNTLPSGNSGNRNILGLIVDNTFEITAEGTTNITTGTATGNGLTVTHYLGLDGKIDLEGDSQLIQTE
ncbi:choice-of-anchor D domain-containing protein, partial [Lutibacter sp.]|uniref:choice-of-anchor D domain-containing protein n=1 Tax=Lutibacter sp. TaxID=1925666 RepID=UPI0034A0195B